MNVRRLSASDDLHTSSAGTVVDRIAEELRRRISEQEILPGAKLKELEVAREFGVSRARVREALAALELRGLVERIPNRGAVVRRVELSEVFEIYDVREVLEGLAVRRAVENGDSAVWAGFLKICNEEFEKRALAGEIELYEKQFHHIRKKIIELAANPILAGMLDSVQDHTRVIMRRVLILPGRIERGIHDLRGLLEAMSAGDAGQAERIRRASIRGAIEDLKRFQRFVL